jgi:hypothetical protein
VADSRSDAAVDAHVEASQRFDYFVTGGAGTVLAYAVQSYDPTRVPLWPYVAVAAWGLLLTAVGFGLLHLSTTVEALRIRPVALDLGETADTLREARQRGVGVSFPGAGLTARNAVQVQQALDMCEEEIKTVDEKLTGAARRKKWLAIGRNSALFAGLLALALWRIGNL